MNIIKYIKVIHRNTLPLYTLAMKNQKEKLRKYSPLQPKNKILRNKFTLGDKRPVCKKLSDTDERNQNDTDGWRDIPCPWIEKINIVKMTIAPK